MWVEEETVDYLSNVRKAVLRVNLEIAKGERDRKDFILVCEESYQEFTNFLLEEERYEDLVLLRDNKSKMVTS